MMNGPVRMPDTMALEVGNPGGEPWRLLLYVPPDPAPPDGWPLLVMVDGNAVFATAVDALRAQGNHYSGTGVTPGVVAAVGYPVDTAYDFLRRSWDLSPPPGRSYPPFSPGGPVVRTGGALLLLDGLAETMLPLVAARAPVNPRRRTLFGHSFGGLFALLTLFRRPDLFDTIVAASPSLTWEENALSVFEQAFDPSGHAHRVLLSAGEWEGDTLGPFERTRPDADRRREKRLVTRTVAEAEQLAVRLASRGLDARFELFAGETHMSVLPVAINRAVQATFTDPVGPRLEPL